jgi:RimJ/RimL family protein N-acetyltransferase
MWAIHDEGGHHIGGAGIHNIDWIHRSGGTGIVIGDETAWGKGYGRETMALRTRYAFEELGLNRLTSECFVENEASSRCLAATGYKKLGIARQARWKHGAFHDTILWDFLAQDYFAAASKGEAA